MAVRGKVGEEWEGHVVVFKPSDAQPQEWKSGDVIIEWDDPESSISLWYAYDLVRIKCNPLP